MTDFNWHSAQGYELLVNHLLDGIFVVDHGNIVYANQPLADMLGYALEDMLGHPFPEFIAAHDRPIVQERYQARLRGESALSQYEAHLVCASGKELCCMLNVTLTQHPEGRLITIGSVRDITAQKNALIALEDTQQELQAIFDHLPDVFYRADMQGIITLISPVCFDHLGYRQEEMLGRPMAAFYYSPADREQVVQAIREGNGRATQVEAMLRHKDGRAVWVSTNARLRRDAKGNPMYIEGVARDITQRKKLEEQLLTLSRTDSLTGLYNRQYFLEQAETLVQLMRRYQHPAAILMADLDHFKTINDQYGHHIGDLALQAFTQACQKEVRESDLCGRLGGEEFVILLPETTLEQAEKLAERIRLATAAIRIETENGPIGFTVSIGLCALLPSDRDLDAGLIRADQAMYLAKRGGRNRVYRMASA